MFLFTWLSTRPFLCAQVRFLAVAFCVAVPMVQALTGKNPFGANPLAAPVATADKKKK